MRRPRSCRSAISASPVQLYTEQGAIALEPPLLTFAVILLLIDALISLGLRGFLPVMRRAAPVLAVLALFHNGDARADDAANMKAALDTRLAYVMTGLSDVDDMSRAGLTGLGNALRARTSYMPQDPVGVDVAKDDLTFYPLLYWPMDPREKDLPPQALSKIADYMRNGGTILFDTRDLTLGAVRGPQSPGEITLKRLVSKLDIPPLEVVPADPRARPLVLYSARFPRTLGGRQGVGRGAAAHRSKRRRASGARRRRRLARHHRQQ